MPKLELYSAPVCPFAQRTRLALLEKHIEFTLSEIDLNHKPEDFGKISPYSKIPVLKRGDDLVWESAIINEYLEEVYPQPALMPLEPGKRALARFWIDFCNVRFVPTFYKLLLAQSGDKQNAHREEMLRHLRFLENQALGKNPDGLYFHGKELTLTDLTFYPFFERFCVLKHYRQCDIPADCARLKRWLEHMRGRASVKAAQNDEKFYLRSYAKYADGSASGVTAQEMRSA
ncbi:MAG TPA: glutathione S-transferase family protein [Burkholderiales bacterium]|nr:glutathione S-transferase family protein [Burkholderiales bacterium]